jgi:hypothetical protein
LVTFSLGKQRKVTRRVAKENVEIQRSTIQRNTNANFRHSCSLLQQS